MLRLSDCFSGFKATWFQLKAFILYRLNRLIDILMAPLYFHLGSYTWFIDTLTLSQQLAEILILHYCYTFSVILIILMRNEKFQIFLINLFKILEEDSIKTILLNKFHSVLSLYIDLISITLDFMGRFFKK